MDSIKTGLQIVCVIAVAVLLISLALFHLEYMAGGPEVSGAPGAAAQTSPQNVAPLFPPDAGPDAKPQPTPAPTPNDNQRRQRQILDRWLQRRAAEDPPAQRDCGGGSCRVWRG